MQGQKGLKENFAEGMFCDELSKNKCSCVGCAHIGRLLTVETVAMPVAKTNHVISHVTRWHDNVDVDNAYAFTLRVFTLTDQRHQHLNLHHLTHHHHYHQQAALQLQGSHRPVLGVWHKC